MYWKLLKNDIKHNLVQTINIAFFIVLSVAFLAAAGQLAVQLTSSINHLFETAKTPHILQMHTGDINQKRLQKFVASHSEIEDYQILNFLNVDNALLAFNGKSLKDSVYDNGFSTQSPRFDYLLDLKGDLIKAEKGQVYVPIFYATSGLVKKGDRLTIGSHALKVAGFVRDSQMNSSLSVSRRFIINQADYDAIEKQGELEYLIEFRLNDLSKTSAIETAYSQAGLEADGPPLMTYTLFQIVNAFSDGITILVMTLISFLVIGISLLCIRLMLLAKFEEDYRELAVLKAIGIPLADIKKIFLSKYLFIAALSSFIGFLLSFLIKRPFLNNMKMFFGEADESILPSLVAFLLALLIFLIIYISMRRLSRRLKDLSLNPNQVQEKESSPKYLSNWNRTLRLAVSDLLARSKIYRTMILVFILSIFVLTVPMSIYSTISNKSFVNYLGIGSYDVRVDLSQISGKDDDIQKLIHQLQKDKQIQKFDVFRSKMASYQTASGATEKIWLDFGNQNSFPIQYLSGRAPRGEKEISLSKLKADDLSKEKGDQMTLMVDGKERKVTVSGIFSDLTNGGKTARAAFKTDDSNVIWMIMPIKLKNGVSVKTFINRYQTAYPFAKFSDVNTYLKQIFGNTIAMVQTITWVAFTASVFLIFLITTLFIRMLYLKDQGQNALLKAIGFTNRDIYRQYVIKAAIILALGLLIGNLLAVTLGDWLGAALLSMIGISGIDFIRNPLFTYLLVPLAMLLSTFLATYLGIRGLKTTNISQLLKEDV